MGKYDAILQGQATVEINVAQLAVLWDLLFYELDEHQPNIRSLSKAHSRALSMVCARFENMLADLGEGPRDDWEAFVEEAKSIVVGSSSDQSLAK